MWVLALPQKRQKTKTKLSVLSGPLLLDLSHGESNPPSLASHDEEGTHCMVVGLQHTHELSSTSRSFSLKYPLSSTHSEKYQEFRLGILK